jgi:hypothetical protein
VLVWATGTGTQVGYPDPEVVVGAFRLDDDGDLLTRMRAGLDELVAEATG